jgi:YVTN family beta-propeller protein
MKKLMQTVLVICLLSCSSISQAAAPGYHVIKKFQLGGEGGWDYLTVDSEARRLYVSRGTHVMVVDMESGKLAGDIPETPGVHGIALAPELNRGFISCGKSDTALIFDMKTLKTIGQVKTGENPDAILYDPASKKIFTFNGGSKDTTVIDAASGTVTATLALGGKPEFAAADGQGNVFVNIEDTSEVVAINSLKPVVVKRASLKPCEEPSGIALDAAQHRLFSGCRNKLMAVVDTQSLKLIATVPIGQGVDGNACDPGTGLAFSANGADGTLTVVKESSLNKFEVLETVPTQRGARTMALDTKTNTLYLPTAQFGPTPVPTPGVRQRPPIVKDSFVILVVGK